MRCKGCGIQLTANNMDNCPNCGPPGEQESNYAAKGILSSLLNVWSVASFGVLILVILSILIYVVTKSVIVAVGAFVVLIAVGSQFFFWFSSMIDG